MGTVFKESQSNCLVCDAEFLFDPSLTFRDKGILATLLAIPDGTRVTLRDLCSLSGEKKNKVEKAWKKLFGLGYLVKTPEFVIVRDFRSEINH